MLGLKSRRHLATLLMIAGVTVPSGHFLFADTMSSTNYKIQADVISIGGDRSTSTNYIVQDTIGDLASAEDLVSAILKGCSGYQCCQATPNRRP